METQNKQRPVFVTMLCSFYFVYWAMSIVALVAALLMSIGSQFPTFSKILNQINLIFLGAQVDVTLVTWLVAIGLVAGVIGYWFFQKWSVIVYAAASVALSIVVLSTVAAAPTKLAYIGTILYVIASAFVLNIAMIVVGIVYFKRMK